MGNSVCYHRAGLVEDYLEIEEIARVELPSYLPDFNLHWKTLACLWRAVSARFPLPAILTELQTALQVELQLRDSKVVDHLMEHAVNFEFRSAHISY